MRTCWHWIDEVEVKTLNVGTKSLKAAIADFKEKERKKERSKRDVKDVKDILKNIEQSIAQLVKPKKDTF